jgi:mannose-6-phosphate isomerase-like protein (cupin superfamily)
MTAPTVDAPPFPHRALPYEEGRLLDVPRLPTHLLVGAEGAGRFSLVHHTLEPHTLGVWPHMHTREDEFSFVLEGRLTAMLGDDVVTAGPGEVVFKPRHQVHAFWNMHEETCRFLEILSPGGFERCFEEAGEAPTPHGPDAKRLIREGCEQIASRYGLVFYFDRVEELLERYGLRE